MLIPNPWLRFFDTFVDSLPETDTRIYLGNGAPEQSEPFVIYNAEQLTRKGELNKLLSDITRTKPIEVWDYSVANIEILKANGITAKYMPLNSSPTYVEKLREYVKTKPKIYDVGFCGTNSPRREAIFRQLRERGLTVLNIGNNRSEEVYGDERDQLLAQCKVHINIHYADDYQIFESARCEPWLKCGTTVVTEPSLDNDPRCIIAEYGSRLVDATYQMVERINKPMTFNFII